MNNEKLRADIKRELSWPISMKKLAELLNRCYVALGEQASVPDGLLDWAVDRWHAEVSQRPLINIHRRTLDETWRQIIRKLGGDPVDLCGPAHADLLAAAPSAPAAQGGE